MLRFLRQILLFLLLIALFGAFLFWPIAQTVRVGFQGVAKADGSYGSFTFGYVAAVFRDPLLRQGLINSATIAVCVTLLCTTISVPLALLSRRYDFMGKSLVNGLLLVPLILPPFVGAIGMRQILGRFGVLTSIAHDSGLIAGNTPIEWFGSARIIGVILVESLSLYPIIYLNVSAALANLDPAMEQAAANLGAGRWRIFRKITLPLMRPGLFAGGTIVLIWSFTELGTPLMFDFYRVTPVQIFEQLNQVAGSPLPYALVVVMLITSIFLYVVGKFVLGSKAAGRGDESVGAGEHRAARLFHQHSRARAVSVRRRDGAVAARRRHPDEPEQGGQLVSVGHPARVYRSALCKCIDL